MHDSPPHCPFCLEQRQHCSIEVSRQRNFEKRKRIGKTTRIVYENGIIDESRESSQGNEKKIWSKICQTEVEQEMMCHCAFLQIYIL